MSRQGSGNTNILRKSLLVSNHAFNSHSSSAGPVIPVLRACGNTHDRHENVAAFSVARSSPPTWHALSRKDHPRVPWQETVLHLSENLNSDCSVCLPLESCVSENERSVFRCCCRNHLSSLMINMTPNDCPVFSEDLMHESSFARKR